MMSTTTALVASAILTFLMLGAGSYCRNQAWAPGGLKRAMGNRDDLPAPIPISGRADRAARNMLENLAMFTALVAAVHFAGKAGWRADLGATIFFWSRLAYWPTYLAGIAYLRTVVWLVSIVGLGMLAVAVWW
jgi:uncharacterized MAPEG superfamily protein